MVARAVPRRRFLELLVRIRIIHDVMAAGVADLRKVVAVVFAHIHLFKTRVHGLKHVVAAVPGCPHVTGRPRVTDNFDPHIRIVVPRLQRTHLDRRQRRPPFDVRLDAGKILKNTDDLKEGRRNAAMIRKGGSMVCASADAPHEYGMRCVQYCVSVRHMSLFSLFF